jgi:hypothetical protein
MPLEQTGPINTLNPAWPVGADGVNTTDDHLRLIKDDLITNLPNLAGFQRHRRCWCLAC